MAEEGVRGQALHLHRKGEGQEFPPSGVKRVRGHDFPSHPPTERGRGERAGFPPQVGEEGGERQDSPLSGVKREEVV